MKKTAVVVVLAYVIAFSLGMRAQQAPGDGPRYTGTALVRPTDYREWIFLSSGLGMTYEPPSANPRPPTFGNVFVNPSSYRSFMQTGKWPDKTIFVLEFRNSDSEASINKSGRFQTGLAAVEAEVKDSRFADGWAFFNFRGDAPAEPCLPAPARRASSATRRTRPSSGRSSSSIRRCSKWRGGWGR